MWRGKTHFSITRLASCHRILLGYSLWAMASPAKFRHPVSRFGILRASNSPKDIVDAFPRIRNRYCWQPITFRSRRIVSSSCYLTPYMTWFPRYKGHIFRYKTFVPERRRKSQSSHALQLIAFKLASCFMRSSCPWQFRHTTAVLKLWNRLVSIPWTSFAIVLYYYFLCFGLYPPSVFLSPENTENSLLSKQ